MLMVKDFNYTSSERLTLSAFIDNRHITLKLIVMTQIYDQFVFLVYRFILTGLTFLWIWMKMDGV